LVALRAVCWRFAIPAYRPQIHKIKPSIWDYRQGV
jgi:hypothetical protein